MTKKDEISETSTLTGSKSPSPEVKSVLEICVSFFKGLQARRQERKKTRSKLEAITDQKLRHLLRVPTADYSKLMEQVMSHDPYETPLLERGKLKHVTVGEVVPATREEFYQAVTENEVIAFARARAHLPAHPLLSADQPRGTGRPTSEK